jgi:hypothetical protein
VCPGRPRGAGGRPPALAETVDRAGYRFWPGAAPPEDELGAAWAHADKVGGMERAAVVQTEIFAGLNVRAMLPGLRAACAEWQPDLVLRECVEFASALAAEQHGVRHARVALGLTGFEAISLSIVRSVLDEWQSGLTNRIGASPYLTRFPASLEDPQIAGPEVTYRFRDPATDAASKALPDWWPGDQSPLVYVTLGSVIGEKPFAVAVFRAVLERVDEIAARVLLTVGNEVDLDALGPAPPNVHIVRWVPQVDVLAHASAVLCHGGSGTMLGALGAGRPLVVVPLFADGPFNARRVAAVGAGIAVEPDTERPSSSLGSSIDPLALREAVQTVLADASYRRAARKLADEMNALAPTDAVLSTLAESGRIPVRAQRRRSPFDCRRQVVQAGRLSRCLGPPDKPPSSASGGGGTVARLQGWRGR